MLQFFLAATADDYAQAKSLFKAYAESIGISLDFQYFDEELDQLERMYGAPYGGIVLAKKGDEIIGCAGIRIFSEDEGELKRMYVRPAYHHQGIGKSLLDKALQLAQNCGYRLVKLDTLENMTAAIRLYKQAGFYETSPYYYNPMQTAVYFEKIL